MEFSDSEDEYEYEQYDLWCFEEEEGPSLIKKKSRLIAAVVNNQVEVLIDLLDSPRWYHVRDNWGYNLLQIAILRDKREVFDYMLSLPDFPLEYVNRDGQTALVVSLDGFISNDIWMSGHFSYELVKKGVNLDVVCFEGNSPLHQALERSYSRTSKALIERGVDVNSPNNEGNTPLELALFWLDRDVFEMVCALLVQGAEPSVDFFKQFVSSFDIPELLQILYFYTFDSFSEFKIDLLIVLKLAEQESLIFEEIIKYQEFSVNEDEAFDYFCLLCSLKTNYLNTAIEKFASVLKEVFAEVETLSFSYFTFKATFNIENLNVLLQNEIISIDHLVRMTSFMHYNVFERLIDGGADENIVTQLYCFFLTYGLDIEERDLQIVYNKFGYCQLFKILLHMDFQMVCDYHEAKMFPMIIYNPSINLDKYLQNPETKPSHYFHENIEELVHYFSTVKLVNIYNNLVEDGNLEKKENLPQLPSLVELARNEFREYFIKKCKIRTSKQFFTLLNCLPISYVHKKILSYETKLY